MRRRSRLCCVKSAIAVFALLTIILFTSKWIAGPDFTNPDFYRSQNLVNLPQFAAQVFNRHPRKFEFDPNDLKDWHDEEAYQKALARKGLGEQGQPAELVNPDKEKERTMFRANGYNAMLSDQISLNRSVPDIRNPGCIHKKYLSKLPQVSIVIPFYDEHWSPLLRSCFAILNRTPPELLKEIILVDDASTKEFLGEKLEKYVSQYVPKTRIVRLPERSGLIVARLAGAKVATADILIFFDSHVEPNYNWLPPLIDPIARNPRACVCPFIDVIAYNTFEYRSQDEGARGAFDWRFYYKRLPLLKEDLEDKTKPFRSPIMAGGLFAIGRDFFWELGGYDEGLDIWGGEQYELSFKIWMCGGEMLDAPCSRVGHIYRGPGGHLSNPRTNDFLHKNYKRVAEVWMDEYKEYLYMREPNRYAKLDAGDLTKQKALREKLQCKSFKWFMEEIAFDLPKKYPPIEPPDYASGAIRSDTSNNLCIDTLNVGHRQEVGLYPCASDLVYPQSNQYWALSWHKDLRLKMKADCLDVSESYRNAPVVLYECHLQGGNQLWQYDVENKWLVHGSGKSCLEADLKNHKVYVNRCDPANLKMKWSFGHVNRTALAELKINKHQVSEEEGL